MSYGPASLSQGQEHTPRYVLLTAAYNEEDLLPRTIECVTSQSLLPVRWIIVSDGSTDRTDEIVQQACARHRYVQLLRVDDARARGTTRKVNALVSALAQLRGVTYDYIGNLDADVSFADDYYATLIHRFKDNPSLGITGGLIYEDYGDGYEARRSNRLASVAHAAQLVRKECFEAIGGYRPMQYGGEDWFAEVSARMRGWQVESCAALKVLHHRRSGGAEHMLRHHFREGRMDFSLGSLPLFELAKCARRVRCRPFAVGALARLLGFIWSYIAREARLAPPDFVAFLRAEQKRRFLPYSHLNGSR